MPILSVSRYRARGTAWIRVWEDRPPICSLPRPSGPNPTYDTSSGTFRPWDWVCDPDWADFNTPWRPFIPIAPPPTLHFTSDMFWVYATNAASSVRPEYLPDGKWRVPSEVTGSYARAKIWLEAQVQFVRTVGGVGSPPPPHMHSPIMFQMLRADSPDALQAAVWPYRRDLLDWFGYFIWALAGVSGQWSTLPAIQANAEFVDFATRYLEGSSPRGVSIRTDDFPTWPPIWRATFRRWLDLGVPVNYPWSAAHAEDRRWLELRPASYPPNWHRVDCSVPRQTAVLASTIHDTHGYKAGKHKESKSWSAALHFSDYSNAEDFINIRIYYRDAVHDEDVDVLEPTDDDDTTPARLEARRFNFAPFRHRLRDSPGLARWRARHPEANTPPHPGPSITLVAPQTPLPPAPTASSSTIVAPTPLAARADDDLVSLGSGEGHDGGEPDTHAPMTTEPIGAASPAKTADPSTDHEAAPVPAAPAPGPMEPAHLVIATAVEPDLEGVTHDDQAPRQEDEPGAEGATHGSPDQHADVDMAGPDAPGSGPHNVFSVFWASVTVGHPGLAAVYEVAPNVPFGIDEQFFAEMTVSIPSTTEARLAQALERNPSVSSRELVQLMLWLGMRFHVSWPPDWGTTWSHQRRKGINRLPLPIYLAAAPASLGPPTMAFHELCSAWLLRADELFSRTGNARLLRYGGIIWRLAMHYGGVDLAEEVLNGPSSSYAFHGWSFTTPEGRHCDNPEAWQDDPVITEAIGTSPYAASPTLWPDPDTWERSGRWSGRWNTFAETWFTSRVAEIVDRTARPLTPRKWREHLRGINQGIRDSTRGRLQLSALLPGLHNDASAYLADSPLSHPGRLQLIAAPTPP